MTNLQVLEKLRARLLKKYAALEAEAHLVMCEETRYGAICLASGVELSVELLDELGKELEAQ